MRVDENDLGAPESEEVRPESARGPCIHPAAVPRAPCPVPRQTRCLLLEQVGCEGSFFSPSFRVRLSSGTGWGSGFLTRGLLLSGQS